MSYGIQLRAILGHLLERQVIGQVCPWLISAVMWIHTPAWEILASYFQELRDKHSYEFAPFLSSSWSACLWLLGYEPFLYVCLNITDLCCLVFFSKLCLIQ